MKTIKLGGVPEHFNLPWHLGIEEGIFEKENLQLSWKDFPDGTGAMCKALREGELDGAVILTEGIIKDIIGGNRVKIVQEYIASPLVWGIHVASSSHLEHLEELKKEKVAISRFGSGSHLMAYVNAKKRGWNPEELEFEVVKDIDGAVEALQSGKAGYFMWEHFTTKPLVDQGVFRRLGDCPTPWPCFVIAFREDFLQENADAVKQLLTAVNGISKNLKQRANIESMLSARYQQKPEDIKEWLKITEWSQQQISAEEVQRVQEELKYLDLIPETLEKHRFIANLHQ